MLSSIQKSLLDKPISRPEFFPRPHDFLLYVGAFSLIAFLFLMFFFSIKSIHTIKQPQFNVVSISFSPFNNASNYVIDWNITLSINNSNEDTIFTYENTQAWLYHKDELLSVGRMEPLIFQGSKEQTLVQLRLTTYDHDGWLSKGIEGEFERNKAVAFDLLLQSNVRHNPKLLFPGNPKLMFRRSPLLVVGCNDLRVDSFNKTNWIMTGALDRFKAIFGLYVWPFMPGGTIGSKPDPIMAGSSRFTAVVQGKDGHIATPHKTRDLMLAASMAVLALQQLISRETDPLKPRVVSVIFVDGGQVGNVILASVRFGGTFRFMTLEGYSYLKQRIKEIIETQAGVHQCSATTDFMEEMRPYPPTINDPTIYDHGKSVGEILLGENNVQHSPALMAAEDFGFYSQKMATAFFFIGID
ncbi:iaa-amino acid hydrolase ilr1-like 3 [Nicotiana attenuata]|uniref:Iaa-amino acid hydrolase ilr1-like 3 n=1 Tax=Nicotiana attenuata TaxID=49451 RepID=A0A314L089_NICAT|nr:iaa-amino acid hydrolase ilr1-like 3 [Nicotiana attenuata]